MTDDFKIKYPKRTAKRGGKNRTNQKDLQKKYAKELRVLGIHKPVQATSAKDLATMKQLQAALKNTWGQVVAEANNYRLFSAKQLEFFRRYAIYGRKNLAKAARAAGYDTENPVVLLQIAHNNLKQPFAEELIRAFEMEEKAKMGLLVEDVASWFESIATKAMEVGDFTNANRAMENYGKYLGMFVDRKEITHKNVYNKAELDARIAELQAVISEERDGIKSRLSIN